MGFSILDNFLKAFGIDKGVVSGAIHNSKRVAFSFANVQRYYIDLLEFGRFLLENNIKGNPGNFVISEIIQNNTKRMAIVTSVLKSNSFSLHTFKDSEQEGKIDIPLIQEYIGDMQLEVKAEQTSLNNVMFTGKEELTFAFSCLEIKLDIQTRQFTRGAWFDQLKGSNPKNISDSDMADNLNELIIDENIANPLLLEF